MQTQHDQQEFRQVFNLILAPRWYLDEPATTLRDLIRWMGLQNAAGEATCVSKQMASAWGNK